MRCICMHCCLHSIHRSHAHLVLKRRHHMWLMLLLLLLQFFHLLRSKLHCCFGREISALLLHKLVSSLGHGSCTLRRHLETHCRRLRLSISNCCQVVEELMLVEEPLPL